MKMHDFDSRIDSAATEVLESMCFVTVAERPESPACVSADWLAVKLDFRGQPSGTFGMCAPLATAKIIASNFLSEDEAEMDLSRTSEVLSELSNMICGSFLVRLGGDGVYDLSTPERDCQEDQLLASHTAARHLQLDEGPLCIWMDLENLQ